MIEWIRIDQKYAPYNALTQLSTELWSVAVV